MVLTHQAALLEIKEAAVAARLSSPERVSPHVLLGYAGIETIQIYTHLDTTRPHHMVRDLHPLNEDDRSSDRVLVS
jgi:integrase/recombinase XerD